MVTTQVVNNYKIQEKILSLDIEESEIILAQSKKIDLLEQKVVDLLDIIEKMKVKKGSHNSSLPPSSDIIPKKKSVRGVSTKKTGGQKGHKGSTLEMSETPDKIIPLKSNFCAKCGSIIESETFTLKAKRQVIEIPIPKPVIEEYQQYSCTCSTCEHVQVADFPKNVSAPIQYGSSVETLVSYYSVYQYVPFKRLQNMFSHVFSLPLSQGSVANILERASQKATSFYEKIKEEIIKSKVVGSDETGVKVNGKNQWVWVWQNASNTYIETSENRGFETINRVFENGLPNSTLISDRWAAQLKTITFDNQICLAHLIRDVTYLIELEKHDFSSDFKDLLVNIFEHKRTILTNQKAYKVGSIEAKELETKLNLALSIIIDPLKYPKTHTFQKSMLKNRNFILPCIYDLDIPPDNNGSERAIRNIKVKQKISGQFMSGQSYFCIIRSVIDTLMKRECDIFPSLSQIFAI